MAKNLKFRYVTKTFYLILMTALLISAPIIKAADPIHAFEGDVLVNQIGYLPDSNKIAVVIHSSTDPLSWKLLQTDGRTEVASGMTSVYGYDKASRDDLHHADFTSFSQIGSYILSVAEVGESLPFNITNNLYPELSVDAMGYFYFHRMGEDILAEHLPDPAFAHEAFHPGDETMSCWNNWCNDEILNVRYSWADAGDFGIYAVNHAISAWTLLNLYERYPHAFPDGSLNIPEQSNGIPDILDEVRFGSTFMKGMLPSEGLASHKVHNTEWSLFPVTDVAHENASDRFAQPPSTNATYAIARNLAHLARLIEPFDAEDASELWSIAQEAWSRADENPNMSYVVGNDSAGGGDYPDTTQDDDRYAAAAELYLTAFYLDSDQTEYYKNHVMDSRYYKQAGGFTWREVGSLGTMSLLSAPNDLPAEDIQMKENNIIQFADQNLAIMEIEGYPIPHPNQLAYPWGSNSFILNKMIIWGYAYDITNDLKYMKAMHSSMDYLLGNNAMKISYITGYGAYAETDVHDRWAWGKYLDGISFPKGWISGGPNSEVFTDSVTPAANPGPKAYAGMDTAPQAWGSKEVTINWNAPLVWVSYYMHDHQSELGGTNLNAGKLNSHTILIISLSGFIGVILLIVLYFRKRFGVSHLQ